MSDTPSAPAKLRMLEAVFLEELKRFERDSGCQVKDVRVDLASRSAEATSVTGVHVRAEV